MMETATDPDAVKATTAITATRTYIPGQRKYAVMERMTTVTGKLMRDAIFALVNIRISAAGQGIHVGRTEKCVILRYYAAENGQHAMTRHMTKNVWMTK
jgi:hypothetical protein